MSEELLKKLGISTAQEDLATMPAGGITFDAGSFIAPWRSGILYQFMTTENWSDYLDEIDEDDNPLVTTPFFTRDFGEWKSLYYEDYEPALSAMRTLNPPTTEQEERYKPRQQWVLYCATADVMNVRDPAALADAFGDTIISDVRIMSLRKGDKRFPLRDRHGFCLIALPAAVAAIADTLGYENVGFDIAELTMAREDDAWTDELYHLYVGNPEGDYEESLFGGRRAKLWASLGEENSKKQAVKGSLSASGKPNRQATDSDKLSTCLGFVQGKWSNAIYMRVVNAKNPAPDALTGNGRRLTIPCITEIYDNEAAARVAANADLSTDDGSPPIPENWAQHQDMWIENVTKFQILDGPPAIAEKACWEALNVTLAEVMIWKEYLAG